MHKNNREKLEVQTTWIHVDDCAHSNIDVRQDFLVSNSHMYFLSISLFQLAIRQFFVLCFIHLITDAKTIIFPFNFIS